MTPRERIDAAWYGLTKKRMEAIIVESVAEARRLEREEIRKHVEWYREGETGSDDMKALSEWILARSTTPDAKEETP